jgi:DNA-binding NarL/FixJ family response regulator
LGIEKSAPLRQDSVKHFGDTTYAGKRDVVTRVLIVDDHAFVRTGLTALLNGADGIVVVGECADGAEVPDIAPRVRPDVVLMDVQMPRVCGLDATRTLLTGQPAVRVLMVSASMTPHTLGGAAAAGASGYLLKGGDPRVLVTAVRTVAAGGTAWPGQPAAAQPDPSP